MAAFGMPGGAEWLIICAIFVAPVAAVIAIIALVVRKNTSGATGAPSAPPAWYPDPTHKHELRYWDGSRWSSSVSDGGVQSMDGL